MGWFEGQVEERRAADQQLLEDSFEMIAGVVLGKRTAQRISDHRIVAKGAIDEILKYYHRRPAELPENLLTAEEQLDYALRPHGLMHRTVVLSKGWYRNAFGPMLAFTKEEGLPVALLPRPVRGYVFTDPRTGEKEKLNAKTAALFDGEAVCFYRSLPQKKLKISDLLLYMRTCITLTDKVIVGAAALAAALAGLIMPRLTLALTGPVLTSGRPGAVISIAVFMLCALMSVHLIGGINEIVRNRLSTKVSLGVEASMMMRLMSLPASFFGGFSPGELNSRVDAVNMLCTSLLNVVLSTGISSLASLVYVGQIFRLAPVLAVPAVIAILLTAGVSVAVTLVQVRVNHRKLDQTAREAGMVYSLITGIQKVKLAGAEKRVFARWLRLYAEGAELTYHPPVLVRVNTVITTAISLLSTIVLYDLAVRSGMSQSAWFAFSASYGMVTGAFTALSGITLTAAQIPPVLKIAEPFLETEPETADGKEIVTGISGAVELNHVSFRYSKDGPYILDDLSLKIRPGDYVAVVGKTGCGKSTLVRLLLGFEKPEKGVIYYDDKDLNSLDLTSLRKRIGTVMQDAGLFQGNLYANIVISAPQLTLEDAWEAAEKAGIADDIRAMPMGMNTVISEGQGSISGGQRQRIMIARAIAPKPSLLIFDEATSALDNKTQRQVSEALDAMGCTRLVIAHRLSTIRRCDRILVLEGGRIIEDGTYDELIAKKGFFAELVERQRLDTEGASGDLRPDTEET